MTRLGWLVALLVACSPAGTRTDGRVGASTAPPSLPPAPAAAAPTPASAPVTVVTEQAPPLPAAPPHFPPPDVPPPSARSAAPGDGHFTPLGDRAAGERAATEPPIVVRTVVHPHPESRWVTVTVAAIDLRKVTLGLVPGTEDLKWANLPVGAEAGLVPGADRAALAFVMNGGFQPKHGRWGLVASGVVVSKPREDGCTIAMSPTLGVEIGPWATLSESARKAPSLRQTPPCLVDGGTLHPSLLAGRDKAWAGHTADLRTRRRSAIGIDQGGDVLFYAIGEETEPRWLAEGLRLAGAARAAELDINWYWTRFLLFGEGSAGRLTITSTLVPKMEHMETEYVERSSTRDFFYAVLRDPAHPSH
jgi:hypothetical protein